jgi:hypothetical protein
MHAFGNGVRPIPWQRASWIGVVVCAPNQDGRCAICGRKTDRLFVDHCHTRGHVRGLLCQTCNTFLGWYEKKADTILRFQAYLEDRGV